MAGNAHISSELSAAEAGGKTRCMERTAGRSKYVEKRLKINNNFIHNIKGVYH